MPRLSADEAASYEPLARSLRQLRAERGLTVRDVQLLTRYSIGSVEAVFCIRDRTSKRAVQAVAAALGADPEEWGQRYDALGFPTARVHHERCQIEGCPNPSRGRRLCRTHARHESLYGDPTAGRFSPKTHPDTCSEEGCSRPYRARGLCKSHYDQQRLNS